MVEQRVKETLEPVHGGGIKAGDEVVGWTVEEIVKVPPPAPGAPDDGQKFQILFKRDVDGRTQRMTYTTSGVDVSRGHVEAWLRRHEGNAVEEADGPRWAT